MSAGISQQFCVRWNSHLGSLGAAFPQLLAGQRFVDVTLACEGHQVHCHRLVLAACSTYFESLLGENPCKHPIIILPRDIKLWEIQALVDFMYKGEVNVSQAGLPDLLKCAEILQIRGLCGSDATLNLNNITSGQQSMAGNTPLSSSSTSSSSSSSIGGASVSSITHSSHNVTATNATTTSATLTTTTSSSTSTLLGSSVVPAGSLTNSSSSSSAAAAVASLSSSVLAASTASGSGATNLNSNQTRNGGGGANGNKIIISCGQQQQSQIANNNQCSISSTAAGNNGGNGLDISSSTQITNILRNELMNPSIKFSTGQQSSSTSASSINASAAIITTPTASIEDGDDSANGSSNELNIKCEEMDDSDGKMRDDYADDMDGPGKLQADKTQQSNNHRPHHHQMPLLTQPTASEFVVIASRQPGTTGIRVKSNENLFENYTSSSHHHPSHIVTNLSDSSEINSDSLILHQHDGTPHQSSASLLLPSATSPLLHHNHHHHHHTPSTMADYTIIDDDDNDDDDLANAQLLPPSLKFNRKTMQISVKNVVTSSAPLLSSSASSLSSASSTTNAAAAAGISAKQHHLSTKQHPNCDMNCTASTHHNHHQHHYHRHNESTIQRLSSESFESIICSPHLDQIPYMDDDDDDQVELMDQQAYVIDDDDDDDVKVIGRYTSGGQMPRLIPFGLLQNQIQNENNNELNIIAGSGGNGNSSSGGNGGGGVGFGGSNGGGGSGVGGTGNVGGSCNSNSNNGGNLRGGGEIHFNHGSHGRNSTQISTIRSMANSSMQQQQQRCNNINSNRKYDTKDSLLVINGDRGAPPPSAVVLRNPRGNQPRTYNTDALYAALMDVKFGESIYRASQIHKVPRKTLRNWMKRWDIKSAYPMPRQLKQAAENKRKNKIINQSLNIKSDI